MENVAITLFELITSYIRFFLLDVFSLLALIGVLFLLLAGGTLGLLLTIKTSGYITSGKVLGSVTKQRVKIKKSGERKEKSTTYLALEYVNAQGATKLGLTSEWHNKYANFKNDERVNIRVVSNPAYDDIYLANEWGALNVALVLLAIGCLFFLDFWNSSAFWISVATLVSLCALVIFLFLRRVEKPTTVPPEKEFHKNEIQPMGT